MVCVDVTTCKELFVRAEEAHKKAKKKLNALKRASGCPQWNVQQLEERKCTLAQLRTHELTARRMNRLRKADKKRARIVQLSRQIRLGAPHSGTCGCEALIEQDEVVRAARKASLDARSKYLEQIFAECSGVAIAEKMRYMQFAHLQNLDEAEVRHYVEDVSRSQKRGIRVHFFYGGKGSPQGAGHAYRILRIYESGERHIAYSRQAA